MPPVLLITSQNKKMEKKEQDKEEVALQGDQKSTEEEKDLHAQEASDADQSGASGTKAGDVGILSSAVSW